MGMDLGITAAKSISEVTDDNWADHYDYDEIKENREVTDEDGNFIRTLNHPIDVWYARKFYGLLDNIPELKESYNDPYVVRVDKKILKKMIEYYSFHEDYFEGFSGLPRLCELYRDYDHLQAQGLNLYFWNSY